MEAPLNTFFKSEDLVSGTVELYIPLRFSRKE